MKTKVKKKTVMVRAWIIARLAMLKFGGKTKSYLKMALAQAWKELKFNSLAMLIVRNGKISLHESLTSGKFVVCNTDPNDVRIVSFTDYGEALVTCANWVSERNKSRVT